MPNSVNLRLPESPGYNPVSLVPLRLGRSINHDPRSAAYPVRAAAAEPKSITWDRHTPVLDQNTAGPDRKGLGSCTANALLGLLGCDPFWSALPQSLQTILSNAQQAENLATQTYSRETQVDPFPGTYPPTDTGSDGTTACNVAKENGWISGFEHAFSMDAVLTALQRGPVLIGITWMSGMDRPTSEGIIKPTGYVRGGHELLLRELDMERGLLGGDNSWSPSWGLNGRFRIAIEDFQTLLDQQGDVTAPIALDQPAPAPQPAPSPTAVPQDVLDWAHRTVRTAWNSKRDHKAAQELLDWLSTL